MRDTRGENATKISNLAAKARQNIRMAKEETRRKKRILPESDTDDVEGFCLVCMEPFSNGRSEERWVQCIEYE